MKTRILSFLLVLVMLFSCLSLNIFAADGAQADQNGEEATATPMTADELKALCQANGIGLDGKVNLDKDAIAGLSSEMLYLIANSNVDDDTNSLALGVGARTHNAVREVIFIDVDGDSGKTFGEGDVQLYVWEDIEKVEEDGNSFYRWANKIYWDEARTDPCDFSFTEDAEGNKTFNDERLQKYVDGKSKLVVAPLGYAAYIDTKETFSPDVISELTTSKNDVITKIISPVNEDPENYEASIWNGYVTNSYIQAAYTYYTIDGKKKYISDQAGYEAIRDEGLLGASYAVTFDVRHREGVKTGAIFNTLRSYITKEYLADGNTSKTYVTASTPVSIAADGSLIANGQDTQFDLKPETWYQLTVYHTPRGLDGIKGTSDDNTFHVFADGKLVATNLEVKFEKGTNSSLANADFEYNGEKLNIYTDFLLGSIRIGQTVKTGVDIDDFRLYYGSPLECAHKWEYSHKHDLGSGMNVLTATCQWCGRTETKDILINEAKTNLTMAEIDAVASNIIENTEFGEDKRGNKGSNWTPFAQAKKLSKYDKKDFKLIEAVKEENGNYYLKWNSDIIATNPETGADFTDFTMTDGVYNDSVLAELVAAGTVTVKEIDGVTKAVWTADAFSGEYVQEEMLGAAYAFTFDFAFAGTNEVSDIFANWRSYTGASFGYVDIYIDLKVTMDGSLYAYDAITTEYKDTGYDFTVGEPAQITFYHTPRGIDGVKDVDDSGSIKDGSDDNTYHVFIDGVYLGTYQAAKSTATTGVDATVTNDDSTETPVKLNPASDFVLYRIRMGQSKKGFSIDNMRLYFDNFKECAHVNANGKTNVKDGKCQYCGENMEVLETYCTICAREVTHSAHAISPEVAVAKRNLTLTDSIDMNLYLELSDAIRANADAKIVLEGADGARAAEYALADLTAEANGIYKVTLPLRSIDMTRKVTAAVYAGDEKISATYTTTVADYLMAVYNASEKDFEKALIEATLNYGAYAQKYFAVKNGDAALDHLLPNGKVTDNVVESTAPVASKEASATLSNVQLTDVSLILTSTTKIKIYFTAPEGVVPTSDTGVIGKESGENEYSVILDGVMPKKLDEQSTVTITAAGEENTVSISVYNCLEAIAGTTDANYVNLAKALYLFGEAAKNYPAQ